MKTREQFEKTYIFKDGIQTYEQYVAMENHTASLFKKESINEYNKNFVMVADYNKERGWSND